ncbi:Copper-binding regulatory protein cuf2 [Schizosaccharomyces pombe]
MIIIDGKNYACVVCLRGHRGSSCQHQERALIEVRTRGRPLLCKKCRAIKQQLKSNLKCVCHLQPFLPFANEYQELLNFTQKNPILASLFLFSTDKDIMNSSLNPASQAYTFDLGRTLPISEDILGYRKPLSLTDASNRIDASQLNEKANDSFTINQEADIFNFAKYLHSKDDISGIP